MIPCEHRTEEKPIGKVLTCRKLSVWYFDGRNPSSNFQQKKTLSFGKVKIKRTFWHFQPIMFLTFVANGRISPLIGIYYCVTWTEEI